MTIPEILELNKSAVKIEEENKKQMNKEMQKGKNKR